MINELRVYSVINLLEGATVIESPEPKDSTYGANNLVENLEMRSMVSDYNAITDWGGPGTPVTRAT